MRFALLFSLVALIAAPLAATPDLAVLIVVDQLRAVDVDRLESSWGDSGFGGLRSRGAQYTAEYSFAGTETGPGHATISTCSTPPRHGIGSNRWWLKDGTRIYSAHDDRARAVGGGKDKLGPAQLRTGTFGDALRAESGGRSKVIALSHKDRAAILTGGHSANLALWFDASAGGFVTSSIYASALPPWVLDFNKKLPARIAEGLWSPLKGADLRGDDQVGEDTRFGGRSFPHHLKDLPADKRNSFYRGSPQAIDDLFSLARTAIKVEKLGQRGEKDLLVLSVSATDYVGHWFGPDSAEMTDMLRRLDRRLRAFTRHLDRQVGSKGYALALTGDHGAPPMPERNIPGRQLGKKVSAKSAFAKVEAVLQKSAPQAEKRIYGIQPPHLWIDMRGIPKEMRTSLLEKAAHELTHVDGVANAFPTHLRARSDDPYKPVIQRSIAPGREGQILFRLEPYAFFDFTKDKTGVDHGSPYSYDRRVPLFVYGSGVSRGRFGKRMRPIDAVASLAYALRAPAPPSCEGVVVPALR